MYHLVRFVIACAVMAIWLVQAPRLPQAIDFVEYFGKGCPPHGPVAQSIEADRKIATVNFEFDVFFVVPDHSELTPCSRNTRF